MVSEGVPGGGATAPHPSRGEYAGSSILSRTLGNSWGISCVFLGMLQWGISLVILFVAIPVIGGVVQKKMRDDRTRKMIETNTEDREAFLRELYDLKTATEAGKK